VPDLDSLRARIDEAEAEQARLFDAYDKRFRNLSAPDTMKARAELQALYARAEAMRGRLLDLKNELRRALGEKPWPH
jgi:polyhydroxyalkanoate synthesis regulator phasin